MTTHKNTAPPPMCGQAGEAKSSPPLNAFPVTHYSEWTSIEIAMLTRWLSGKEAE